MPVLTDSSSQRFSKYDSNIFFRVTIHDKPRYGCRKISNYYVLIYIGTREAVKSLFVSFQGHACPILYAAWKEAGLLSHEDVMTLRKVDSDIEGHPTPVRYLLNYSPDLM